MGVRSAISPVTRDGARDPAQVYAPHGYDLVVDTPEVADAHTARVELIFRRHGETAAQLGMPLLVGEWGAYGRHTGTLPAAWHVVRQFERLLCSETYWTYEPNLAHVPCFPAINRPYPERVAGTLVSYHYNPAARTLEVVWREDGTITAPSRIYIPAWLVENGAAGDNILIRLTPEGSGAPHLTTAGSSAGRYVEIPPTGEPCVRRLSIG
jgi:endoglycosylceramidase